MATLIEKGNPGYSKQQMQLRNASAQPTTPTAPTAPAPVKSNMPVSAESAARGIIGYNSGGGAIYGPGGAIAAGTITRKNEDGSISESFSNSGVGFGGSANAFSSPAASSDIAVQEEKAIGSEISGMANDPDYSSANDNYNKYLSWIEKQAESLKGNYEDNVKLINEQFDKAGEDLKASQAREQAVTGARLQRIGGYLGESGSAMGVTSTQIASHRNEVQSLALKRAEALNAAKNAYTKEDIELAQAKMKEAKDLEETIYQRRKDFIANTNAKAKAAADAEKAKIDQENKLRDDARAVLNTMVSSFGGFDLNDMDDKTARELANLASVAGYPLEALARPTVAQKGQELTAKSLAATERQRAISNAISSANLSLSEQRLRQDMRLSATETKNLGLPISLAGLDEKTVMNQLNNRDVVPDWFIDHKYPNGIPPGTTTSIGTEWNKFRTSVQKSSSSSFLTGLFDGAPQAGLPGADEESDTSFLEE